LADKIKKSKPRLLLVIRIRGSVNINYKIEDTLKMLRLHKVNHGVILQANSTTMGMLKKVKDYVAFGEIDQELLLSLLRRRSLIEGNRPLTEEHLKNKTNYSSIKDLASDLMNGKIQYKDLYKIKPIFRLHPPKGGFRGTIKKSYSAGGILGNVGSYINVLVKKMI